ncbi:MAG: ATP-binding protein [Bacilli bacterium]|nr:ATP-binding protein [Bacilli bacterium]MBN2696008.1 ATP-binding protein [Bacilli bacterium]
MKRITFLTGYYGSGKTEIALNLALKHKAEYLVDLDIINPYFRSREAKELLGEDIEIISSDLENGTYADLPYLSKKIFLPFRKDDAIAIFDLGGNDLGAKVMRQFDQEDMQKVDLFLVLNVFREETKDAKSILELIDQIERSGGFKITGLINNSNLLRETTYDDIFSGEAIISEVEKKSGIPIVYSCVYEEIYDPTKKLAGETLILKLYFRKKWY